MAFVGAVDVHSFLVVSVPEGWKYESSVMALGIVRFLNVMSFIGVR